MECEAGVRHRRAVHAVGVQQSAGSQAVAGSAPGVVVEPAVRLDRVARRALDRGAQHVGLARADVVADQRGDVPVPAVLAQQGGGVPQGEVWFVGPVEVQVGGEQRTSSRGGGVEPRPQDRQHLLGDVAEHVEVDVSPKRSVDAGEAGVERGLRTTAAVPDVGHGTRDETGGEAVEGGRDHTGTDPPERRRPAREVPAPEPTQPGVLHRRADLGREVHDRVDRLDRDPQPPRDVPVASVLHRSPLAVVNARR